jgi:hypothetical protein
MTAVEKFQRCQIYRGHNKSTTLAEKLRIIDRGFTELRNMTIK